MFSPLLIPLGLAALAQGSPTLESRQAVTALSASQIAVFNPYAFYAATGYCQPVTTLTWTCGANCNANPTFKPIASGGNGDSVQFWYVGFDPTLNTIIVGHQGTDTSEILPIITDADIELSSLDPTLFPGISSSVEAHSGFQESQADTAAAVLAAVQTGISQFGATHVTLVGHSLGAAIALLDAVYLPLHLPSSISFSMFGFGTPRVGNQAFANYVDAHLPNLSRVNNRQVLTLLNLVPILPGMFLGFHHPSGEKHILDSGAWVACAGQDNPSSQCTTGDVSNIFEGDEGDHDGPYTGTGVTNMGC
ncbi:Alpha/Beta hydrolase protein [Mycena floridula]|nr:Alpha/Beta hydrolase protein [Mycena floridula]